jgi:hypothetical protein
LLAGARSTLEGARPSARGAFDLGLMPGGVVWVALSIDLQESAMTFRTLMRGLLAAALAGMFGAALAQVPVTDRTAVDPAPRMDEEAVAAALADAGYRDVRNLELAGAIWKAEAVTSQGLRVALRINARNGSISRQHIDFERRDEPEERDD